MADTFQKVFIILVRPYILVDGKPAFHTGKIYNHHGHVSHIFPDSTNPLIQADTFVAGQELLTNNPATDPENSPNKLNRTGSYESDAWFLHSSYTSYDDFRMVLRDLMETYPFDYVRCAMYIPIDFIPIPKDPRKKRKE